MPAKSLFIIFLLFVVAACGNAGESEQANNPEKPKRPTPDPAMLKLGERVFNKNCVVCHGVKAVGNPNWRIRKPDGFLLPPPLNGTAHSWHHPRKWLVDMIKNGSPPGKGEMPSWKNRLSEREIEAVVTWLQSLWPDNVYFMWLEKDRDQ